MKVLIYRADALFGEKKTFVWDATIPPNRAKAYVALFNILNDKKIYKNEDSVVCALHPLAVQGNPEACEALLAYRRNRDGEDFEEISMQD